MNEEQSETFFSEMKKGYELLKFNHFLKQSNYNQFFYLELISLLFEDMARQGITTDEIKNIIFSGMQGACDKIESELKELDEK